MKSKFTPVMAWSKRQKPVCLVLLLLANQLAGFPAPISFRFAYLCHAFPVRVFLLVVCILARPTGSSKHGTTRKNTQRYYTTKHLIRYMYGIVVTGHLEISRCILTQWRVIPCESQSPAASKWKALILLAFTFLPRIKQTQ